MNEESMDDIKKRFLALWRGEYEGRPLIHIRALKDDRGLIYRGDLFPYDQEIESEEDFYLNPETVVKRCRNYIDGVVNFGEAFPRAILQLGPGVLAAYHGSEMRFQRDSIWFEACVRDWDEDFVAFREDNPVWKMTKDLTQALVDDADGEYFVGVSDLNSVSNALSLLRGSGELCMDLVDQPDTVKKYRDIVLETWFHTHRELYYGIIQKAQDGYTDWMGLWAPDLGFAVQSDFSTLISLDMFDEFFMPEIRQQCKELEYTCYHLDGPACIRHLDLILGVEELKGVQWIPGAGAAPAADPRWYPMLRNIQDSGRFVYVYATAEEVLPLVEALDNDKLFIFCTDLMSTPEAGQALMDAVAVASARKS